MSLRTALHHYCRENDIEDLVCLIHITLLNYVSNLSRQKTGFVNLSPFVLSNFVGISEKQAQDLLTHLSQSHPDIIKQEYRFNCKEERYSEDFGISILIEEYEDDVELIDPCMRCDGFHTYSLSSDNYEIAFLGNIEEIKHQLQLTNEDIVKELVIMNTNEDQVQKLADVLVSKLQLSQPDKREDAKKGIVKYLHSFREITRVLADISSDASTITTNVVDIAKQTTGFSELKDLLTSG